LGVAVLLATRFLVAGGVGGADADAAADEG
jgi:hypothetical protein